VNLHTGNYEYVSPSVETLVGYSPEAFMDTDWQTALAMVHPDDAPVLRDALERSEEAGQAEAEYRQRAKNGAYIWVSNCMTVSKDSAGRPAYRTSSIRDISKSKKLEEDRARLLAEADKRTAELEATISSLATGLIVYDTTGKAVMMNKVAEGILPKAPFFTMTLEERHKTVPSEREDGEVIPTEEMPVSRSLRGETVRNVVMSVQGPVNKLWTSVCTAPICTPDGRVVGAVASFVDITDRIQMEENLRHQAELLEHAPVLVRNLKDEIILWNRGMERLYGYSREEALGKVTHTLLRTIHSQPLPEILSTIMAQGQWDGELHHFRRDGSIVVVTSVQTLHVERDGTPSAIIEVNNDITERKRLEEALQRLNVTLEQQVVERTATAEGRAKQLQALTLQLTGAEERERRRISELLHDGVQQLLSASKFHLSALLSAVPAASSVVARVDKLLEESIEKSRRLSQDLSPPVLFHAGLAQAVEWLARQMQERYGLKVKVEAPVPILVQDDLLKVFIFRWIQEILFNVVKHAGVDCAVVRLERRDERLELEVSDEGRGFDPQSLFGTGSSGGLGLFSIRERISYLGGQLEIKSAPGRGTRLRLSIPMLDRPKKLMAPPYPAQQPPTRTERSEGEQQIRYRILLADDHKVLRQGLLAVLEGQSDFQVVGEAANGRQAVELARSLKPDLVVMDIMMPEMDGIGATRQIKAEFPHVRVIGLSMMDDEEITGRLLEAGAEAFINKGDASETLIEAIRGKPGI
jgi:PAS domain S-box-containing protein